MNLSNSPSERRRSPGSRWSRAVGVATGLAGVAFVVRIFLDNQDEVLAAAADARPSLIFAGLLAGGAAMTGIGLTWRSALRMLGSEVGVLSSLRGYFVGQLGKYVPGGVWAIMGRGEWARAEGVPGAVAYSSVVLSMGSAYLSALLVGVALLPFLLGDGVSSDVPFVAVLVLLPVGLLIIHPTVLRWALDAVRRVTRRELVIMIPSWRQSASLVVRQLPSWILIGSANYLIAVAFGSGGDVFNVVSATAVSWVVGFLALPVPGGLGVREGVFVALATSLPAGIAATVALVARLVFIAVDTCGAGVSSLLLARRRTEVK